MRDYEPDVSQILALYQQLEDDIVASMTKRMLKMGKVSESTKYEAEILQAAGLVYEDILELIAQRTDATKQHVKALFEDAGVQTVAIDNQIHKQNGILPVDIRQDASLLQILEAGYKKTLGMMKNMVSTTANLAQTAFISACDRAYMQVSSGAFSYQQAISQAVKSFGDTGAMVQYPSGHRDRIDVAVRRAVLTGVGQTSASVALQHAKDSDCKFMELTAHSGARPDHAAWQGQLVSLDGKNVGKIIDGLRVFSLEQIGYGTGAGFKGWNCRHNWHPYYVGLSTPNYTPEQLKALDAKNILYNGKYYSEYEISQIQRRYEREIRAAKREQVAFQTAFDETDDPELKQVMQESLNFSKSLVKDKQAKMRDFIQQTGQKRDYFREQNYLKENSRNGLTFSANSGNIVGKQFYSPLSLDNLDACLEPVIRIRQRGNLSDADIRRFLDRANEEIENTPKNQQAKVLKLWNVLISNVQEPIKLIEYKKEFILGMSRFILNCYEKDMDRHQNIRKMYIEAIQKVPVLNKYTIGGIFCGKVPYVDENGNEHFNTGLNINDELFKRSDSYIVLLHELGPVSNKHLRAHETTLQKISRLILEK
ncbi:MAG: phage minor capsid protein, partial [Oscillospiraceae bacterium]|nr:phage minor capsid protein [Oscillospiraceae bacterium]